MNNGSAFSGFLKIGPRFGMLSQKPKRRLFEVLKSQGLHAQQPVTFRSDGGETVRNLQMYLNPLAEHVLDWFHVTMRLTVMGHMVKGMERTETPWLVGQVEKELDSLKWHLWNGNVLPALRIVDGLQIGGTHPANSSSAGRTKRFVSSDKLLCSAALLPMRVPVDGVTLVVNAVGRR
jgi:hypothetical protein